jgi:ketosteroid isomerase-like protein
MKRQELQERVRKVYESFDLGDLSAYRAAFADGIVWHVPGDNPCPASTGAPRPTSRPCPAA